MMILASVNPRWENRKPIAVLTSMEERAVPTRAEVSDIFNTAADGASGVMITGESAVGKYPVEAIRYLANTARAGEEYRKRQMKG